MPFVHGVRDMVSWGKDKTILQEEFLKDGLLGRKVRCNWNVTVK
jgi:hypothetical protein